MLDITHFDFEDDPVRVIDRDGEPWFVAKDVCRILEISKYRDAVARLEADEKGPVVVDTPGGQQSMSAVNLSGLFALIFTSRKPEAKRFRKWVTSEVLPALYDRGSYTMPRAEPAPAVMATQTTQEMQHMLSTVREARLLFGTQVARELWRSSDLPDVGGAVSPRFDIQRADVEQFLAECCEATGDSRDFTPVPDLLVAYRDWSDAPLPDGVVQRALHGLALSYCDALTGQTYRRHKRNGTRGYLGLRLRSSE